jgi:hypothetical protein
VIRLAPEEIEFTVSFPEDIPPGVSPLSQQKYFIGNTFFQKRVPSCYINDRIPVETFKLK